MYFKLIIFLLLINQTIQYGLNYEKNLIKEIERQLKLNKLDIEEILNNDIFDDLLDDKQEFNSSEIPILPPIIHNEPDFYFNAQQMIEYRGFKYEAHNVITQDCYILQMHRIINPNDKSPNKVPILLQHGLLDSSTGWMINSLGGHIDDDDDRNLAFALAKRGYDVWLGNYRGNSYSKGHTKFSVKDPLYWRFTYDNHALQDLPAQIAHVQNVTNYDQISYVGFSQGTMTAFQLLALKPDVAKAIRPAIMLAPVASVNRMPSPLRLLAKSRLLMKTLLYRNSEFLPNSRLNRIFSKLACKTFPGLICKNFLYLICGFSNRQLNSTRMPVYFNHLPAGTSLANLMHFGQNANGNKFSMLDYMIDKTNLECYNSLTPPKIPLNNIKLDDLYLLNSINDLLADVKDVNWLKKQLTVKFQSKTVDLKQFSHIDFILSKKSDYFVNDYIFDVLKQKSPSMTVAPENKVRLRKYDSETCKPADKKSKCHLNWSTILQTII